MSIINQLPHNFRPIKPSIFASAPFGAPVPGRYSFDIPANIDIPLFTPRDSYVYLLERLSWNASISGAAWASSSRPIRPTVTFYTKQGDRHVNIEPAPYTLSVPTQGVELVVWLFDVARGNTVYAQVAGELNQIAETVGKTDIDVSIDLDVYEIGNMDFQKHFVSILSKQVGQQARGML